MTFPVFVIYLKRGYTYDVETVDWEAFTCRRRPTEHYEDFGAPPEQIHLKKGEAPKEYEFGEHQVQLQNDLLKGIRDFFREYGTEFPSPVSEA